MTTYLFEVVLENGTVLARVDAKNREIALEIVRTWHPISIILTIN
jgi:hypothetical protein